MMITRFRSLGVATGLTLSLFALAAQGFAAPQCVYPPPPPPPGGTYTGPTDVAPPSGGPSTGGPSRPSFSGQPSGPSSPSTGGPATGGGGQPSTGGAGPRTGGGALLGGAAGRGSTGGPTTGGGGGMQILEDYGRWIYWWETNKERYLRVKHAVHSAGVVTRSDDHYMGAGKILEDYSLRPTRAQVREQIVPALLAELGSTRNRDVTSECLIALAKIGAGFGNETLRDIVEPHLARGDRRVREAAILALGIAQDDANIDPLIEILQDSKAGRELMGRDSVDTRSSAFAAYALGCIGAGTKQTPQRELIAHKLLEVVNASTLR